MSDSDPTTGAEAAVVGGLVDAGGPTGAGTTADHTDGGGRDHRTRLSLLSGPVLYVGLLAWMTQLTLIDSAPGSFVRSQEVAASLGGRLLACVVLLAAVHHLLDGVRRAFLGGTSSRADAVDATIRFLTWALVVPGWAVLLRPWLEGLAP